MRSPTFLLLLLLCLPLPALANAAPEPGAFVRATLTDGQVLRGTLVSQDEDRVVLQVAHLGEVTLERVGVKELEVEQHLKLRADGQLWHMDRSRTRYLYSPSAFMLKKGEGYFSQKELLFSSVAYGLTDHVSVVAGTVVPAWFPGYVNFIGGVKVGTPLSEKLHIAAGAETLALPISAGSFLGGLLFASATYGTPDLNFTLSVGRPLTFAEPNPFNSPYPLILTPNATWRFSRSVALVSENWVMPSFPDDVKLTLVNALAARLIGERWTADVGLIHVKRDAGVLPFPVPWVDFSYHFGN